jgi:hypothetical protein
MGRTRQRTRRRKSIKQSRRRVTRHRGFLGGGLADTSASFSSQGNGGAAGWVEGHYGNEDQQYNNVFDIGSKTLGNTFTQLPASQMPTNQSLSLIQSAGRRRRKGRKGRMSKKRGGFLMGEVINQAVVPFGLLALQNRYGRRKSRMNNFSRKFKR